MADHAVVEGAAVVVKALMASIPVGSSGGWACCCSAAAGEGAAARSVCAPIQSCLAPAIEREEELWLVLKRGGFWREGRKSDLGAAV